MLFEFYEKLINASSQTISSWFDYNSHDMLNKLGKFSRNKLRWKNNNLNIAYYFFHRYRDIGKKLVSQTKIMDKIVPITMKTNNFVFLPI